LLLIEQPLGTGYSQLNNPNPIKSTEEAAVDFEAFLIRFFELYPSLKENPLFLVGQSYGGHWIPVFAKRLMDNS